MDSRSRDRRAPRRRDRAPRATQRRRLATTGRSVGMADHRGVARRQRTSLATEIVGIAEQRLLIGHAVGAVDAPEIAAALGFRSCPGEDRRQQFAGVDVGAGLAIVLRRRPVGPRILGERKGFT